MSAPAWHLVTVAERPDLEPEMLRLGQEPWPEFMLHDAVVREYWMGLYRHFTAFQLCLVDGSGGQVLAVGNTVPVSVPADATTLPDEGVDWALPTSHAILASGGRANTLCALQIVVRPEYLRRQLSASTVEAMQTVAARHGLGALIAPVRPILKHRYPHMAMDRYVRRTNDDGEPFDPWIRVHTRLGARTLNVCARSMRIRGTVQEWEKWAGMTFPESGFYVVPGALVPVRIDVEADCGLYVEPNVWMVHRVAAA